MACGAGALPFVHAADGVPQVQLSFDVQEGRNLNSFLRADAVAAHLVLRSGEDPRVLVAFPAGNSGVGLWFEHLGRPVAWKLLDRPQPVVERDAKGRLLYGIVAKVSLIGATDLAIKQAVLSSVRVLRDYQAQSTLPQEVTIKPFSLGTTVTWARNRLDGAAGYRLSVEAAHGVLRGDHIKADADGRLELTLIALSGETPLSPLPEDKLLDARARPDSQARNTLTFLSYREKFLAGSWRFNTYFGRDTLMSLDLLMSALTPTAIEAGLDSVLARLSPQGEVAHEEDVGEYAILDHLRTDGSKSADPTFNYSMIDGNFLLAPVARAWMLDDGRGRSRSAPFLARDDGRDGVRRAAGADLVSNLRRVIQSASAFGDHPQVQNLIGLKEGHSAGEWRDSGDGLGGGHYPYDVNAVLVPAALDAAAQLYSSRLLDPYLNPADRSLFARATALSRVWHEKAPSYFEVGEPNETARKAIQAYAASLQVSADAALASVGQGPMRFHALALRSDGSPVPVVNSDEGFALLFSHPTAQALDVVLDSVMKPFPAGLLTDAGIVVANPVFAARDLQERFTNRAYHGTVVWSWQQAMLAEGLARQLRRRDLLEPVVRRLKDAQRRLWQAIAAGRTVRNSELWSWRYESGKYHVAPFGASDADADESNAAQLWSTVYLAIGPPGESR
jgi:hypothetical protein